MPTAWNSSNSEKGLKQLPTSISRIFSSKGKHLKYKQHRLVMYLGLSPSNQCHLYLNYYINRYVIRISRIRRFCHFWSLRFCHFWSIWFCPFSSLWFCHFSVELMVLSFLELMIVISVAYDFVISRAYECVISVAYDCHFCSLWLSFL